MTTRSVSRDIVDTLARLSGAPAVEDADLRGYSRWRAGGTARVAIEPVSAEATQACLSYLADKPFPKVIVGDGSNILFDDAGFDGVVIRIGAAQSAVQFDGEKVRAQAGIWVPQFVHRLCQRGLGGLEHAIGIPGTLGGLVVMNGGSRRLGVGRNLLQARGCDINGVPFERDHAACQFRYRGSTLQDDGLIILEADFAFTPVDRQALRRDMISIMVERRRKFPKNLPNCGSVFLSDPKMYDVVGPPGAAIERAGLKGLKLGDAQISPLHANFIVNLGAAKAGDILGLIHHIRTTVHQQTGFWMDAEVRHIAPDGRIRPAHEAAAKQASTAILA
ncbi:UDP-N-acetylenolpyruvoylglucosamine reductase [Caulobacter vibrioides]|uniref:UDP-N-acetylenolpyruvoylglucosamine reductase n=1 Tax=Caulobacter vibrioides TaxID=155892 RepID=A0A290MT38_CAUVI|nr:UDP-N-acetylmuramate dehydrogenase [Caulobacter vibrioides]ATC33012.1 UDP-N-acetylenolpyruvoylglucosamine reductase [Caulobacter vibrioides]